MNYYNKYLKYKQKYTNLKNMIGAGFGNSQLQPIRVIKPSPNCAKCRALSTPQDLHKWDTLNCDECLYKKKFFGEGYTKDSILAEKKQEELIEKFWTDTEMTSSDKVFTEAIPHTLRSSILLIFGEITKKGYGAWKLYSYPKLYEIFSDNDTIVRKYINILYKETINTIAAKSMEYLVSQKVDDNTYFSLITKDNLPNILVKTVEREMVLKIVSKIDNALKQENDKILH